MKNIARRLFATSKQEKESILKLIDKKLNNKKKIKITEKDETNPELN